MNAAAILYYPAAPATAVLQCRAQRVCAEYSVTAPSFESLHSDYID